LGIRVSEVDDLVQDVFLIAHTKGGFTPGEAKPQSWLSAIAVRLVQNKRRSLARNREDANDLAMEFARASDKTPAERLELQRSLERVQIALDSMDVDHRAAFILYELENESCQTIAELLQVPVGTVYSRLHKARQRFLAAYEGSGDSPSAGLAALALFLGVAS
jgi:RNA polymerase sigma-70 factor (ECF subfamily)